MKHPHDIEDFIFYWTVGLLVAVVCVAVFALTGCADERTKLFNAADIQSPLSREAQYRNARQCAQEVGGYVAEVDGKTNSMGQALSSSAWLVLVPDWDRTAVTDVVATDTFIHQVISRDDDAIRTCGMNNSLPEWEPVFAEDYRGTLVAQFYYRRVEP